MTRNLTLDMLYHPDLVFVYRIYQSAVFFISSNLFSVALYLILIKSNSDMGIYKLLLIYQLVCAYLVDLTWFIFQPMMILPYFLAYSNGPAKHMGPNGVYIMFIMTFFFVAGLVHANFLSLVYRVSIIYDESKISKIFQDVVGLVKCGIVSLICFEMIVFIPIFVWFFTDIRLEDLRKNIISQEPVMTQLFILEPTTTGIDFLLGKYVLFTGFITYILIVVIFLSLLTINTGLFILRMKNLRSTISTTTYKLQIMLFKTLLVQLGIIVITLFIPFVTFVFSFATRSDYGSLYSSIALFPMSLHTIGNASSMFYFIRPYRKCLIECIKKICMKFQHRSSTIGTTT